MNNNIRHVHSPLPYDVTFPGAALRGPEEALDQGFLSAGGALLLHDLHWWTDRTSDVLQTV